MYRCKILNLYEVVLNCSLFNTRSIFANNFFESIGFVNNKNDQENSTLGVIFKNKDKIPKNKTNIEYLPIKKKSQKSKKLQLILKIMQVSKSGQTKITKLQVTKKKKPEKEIKSRCFGKKSFG